MNIGIVTTWFERGAAYVSKAYRDVLARNHNVFVYARCGESYARNDPNWNRDYVTWGSYLPKTRIVWEEFRSWIDQNKIQCLIFNEQHSWEVILRCVKYSIPIGTYIDYYTQETVPFFKLYDFLLCNTERHYNVFKSHPNCVYISWGTNLSLFKPNIGCVSQYGVKFFHSAGMGGINNRKGTDLVVKAFQGITGNTNLIIHSQAGLERFEDAADIIENDKRIQFIHKTVAAPGLYHMGDIYVYPSKLEGVGLTIAEALACGLPVIATNYAPMNQFIKHGINGRLVEIEQILGRADGYYWPETICSIKSLSEQMQFYADNQKDIPQFKKDVRKFAETYMDWNKNTQDLSETIETILSKRGKNEISPELLEAVYDYEKNKIIIPAQPIHYPYRDMMKRIMHGKFSYDPITEKLYSPKGLS